MMGNKLWIALCALLLINVGSADHDDGHTGAPPTSRSPTVAEVMPSAPAADSLPASSLNQTSHATAASSALNSSDTNARSNGNATTNGETPSVRPQPKNYNDTEAPVPEKNKNLTDHTTSQPPSPHSESHIPTSHVPPTSTAAIPAHTTHTVPANTSTTTPPSNMTHHPAGLLPDSITSSQPAHPKTHSPTSSPTPKSAITTTNNHSTSTPSTSSSQKPPNSQPPTLTPQPNTSQSDRPLSVSEIHPKTTITTPTSISAQTKGHADNPSQLNVGGDTTMAHESPTLDPLLAGLVSAFIITAVIITLLLFLKLRRRDNRPEFRRLQDLPMDDMMEDTPLSMYSY